MEETGVRAVFCAAHMNDEGKMHGHSFEVEAWFPAGDCALELQERLEQAVAVFDHDVLEHELRRGEAIAAELRRLLPDATEIVVRRPLERIFARSRRP